MELQRGMRGSLNDIADVRSDIYIDLNVNGNAVYDYTCFGVDADDKLSDDRYMIFYNQTRSPNSEIGCEIGSTGVRFRIIPAILPPTIQKLVFTINIDGKQTMSMINNASFSLSQQGRELLTMRLSGKDFGSERAIILIEIYRKNDIWRYNCVARGFNGGLSDLLRYYGGTEVTAPTAPTPSISVPTPPPISVPPPPPVSAPPKQEPAPAAQAQKSEKISLRKGEKVSLTKSEAAYIRIENGWTALGKDYDLKALIRYRNGKQLYIGAANSDERLRSPEGAVVHGGDIKRPGELEHIDIKWHPDIASIAVSSYSAIENGTGSFRRYGVYVRIINGRQIIEIPAKDTSANDRSYTLCFGELIFGKEKDHIEVSALEMYSKANSERRIGYKGNKVCMDIGPEGRTK